MRGGSLSTRTSSSASSSRSGVGSVCQSERAFQSHCSFSLFFPLNNMKDWCFFKYMNFHSFLTLSFVLRILDEFEFLDLLKLFCMQVYAISLELVFYFLIGV